MLIMLILYISVEQSSENVSDGAGLSAGSRIDQAESKESHSWDGQTPTSCDESASGDKNFHQMWLLINDLLGQIISNLIYT